MPSTQEARRRDRLTCVSTELVPLSALGIFPDLSFQCWSLACHNRPTGE